MVHVLGMGDAGVWMGGSAGKGTCLLSTAGQPGFVAWIQECWAVQAGTFGFVRLVRWSLVMGR